MKQKVKVYKEGGTYIGVLPSRRGRTYKRGVANPILKPFREAYIKAEKMKLKKQEIFEHVWTELFNSDMRYIMGEDEYKDLVKREANRRHQILKRYRRKLEWFTPNYFVTFTYDDTKQTEEEFEEKLIRAIANLSYRNGWRGMGAAERGKKNDRLHYHFMFYIPEGQMIGELFTDYHWNGRKREYFTNNTYFHERFGDADFKRVTVSDRDRGAISNYLVKYIVKDGGHIYYTRHLPTEKEVEIDMSEDVVLTFIDYSSVKVILDLALFLSPDQLNELGVNNWPLFDDEEMGFNLNTPYNTRRRS